jgi:multicomponent Na+:H+ antiporter subunit B
VSVVARWLVFFAGALPLLALLVRAGLALPAVGTDPKQYGQTMIDIATTERQTSDAVAAVNFDTRGFDTLGEETILFAAVMGVTLLLRKLKGEREDPPRREAYDRESPGTSDAVRALTLGLTMPLVLLGLQVVSHGQVTPGGGFQGGVILATAPLAVFVAGDLDTFQRIAPHGLVVAGESLAALWLAALWVVVR